MPVARIAAEQLLLFLFRTAGLAFLAAALATGGAFVAVLPLQGPDAPQWLGVLARASLAMAGTFLATGALVFAARPPSATAAGGGGGRPGRNAAGLLALSLVALPALSFARARELTALWREILVLLERVGFWNAFEGGGMNSGLVLLPVLAALVVPALEAAAAFFLIAVPPGLLALLATRSPLLPRTFAMLAACQAGLVLASLIGADAFSRLATDVIALMSADRDAGLMDAIETLRRAEVALASTARGFVAPAVGYVLWVPVLLLRRQAVEATAPPPPIVPAVAAPIAPPGPGLRLERAPYDAAPFVPPRLARSALVALGVLMLAFFAAEQLRSRARYESSEPALGATLASAPAAVRVSFGGALDPSSQLWVDRTAPGEAASRVGVSSGLDPDDPERKTLRAELSGRAAGRHHVSWSAVPAAGGGVPRPGSFTFEVGRSGSGPAPGGVQERDSGRRGRRSVAVGAVLLIALGAILPALAGVHARAGRRPGV